MPTLDTFKTSNDLPAGTRDRITTLLNEQLADLFDLYSQTKQAHWNVKGPHFHQLHNLFDALAADLLGHIDTIAERVTALGGTATGTARMAAKHSRLPEYPLDVVDGMACVEALAVRYANTAETTRAGIEIAEKSGDLGTTDLLSDVSRSLDKSLWFLEAHLQEK